MQPFEGMGFPAVEIEHSFAKFLGERIGKRGEPWDADAFRGGYIADIGKALQAVAARLRLRCNALSKKIVNCTGYDVTQLNRLCDRLDEVATQ